jgi:hypothetical protein
VHRDFLVVRDLGDRLVLDIINSRNHTNADAAHTA